MSIHDQHHHGADDPGCSAFDDHSSVSNCTQATVRTPLPTTSSSLTIQTSQLYSSELNGSPANSSDYSPLDQSIDTSLFSSSSSDMSSSTSDDAGYGNTSLPIVTNLAPLFTGAGISVEASFCSILQYAIVNHLSFHALSQLIELIRIHLPTPNECASSIHSLKKHFRELQGSTIEVQFCSFCSDKLEDSAKRCAKKSV